jgi:hypothetical protein
LMAGQLVACGRLRIGKLIKRGGHCKRLNRICVKSCREIGSCRHAVHWILSALISGYP